MSPEAVNLQVVVILTLGFALSSILGYITQKIKLSPILGYLLAGYIIGPYSPGYVADLKLAEQLAEVGVMLMMFGVGLHFKWQDLVNVKNIAIPGAIVQTLVTAFISAVMVHLLGGSWASGVIMGLAIGVASTVVLVRVLSDNNLLHTQQGHIAVGWLIVEDILTVIVLILLPTIVSVLIDGTVSFHEIVISTLDILVKLSLLTVFMFTWGRKIVSGALLIIARTRSQELFILTVLALIFSIATGSAYLFGTSIALGAFIAGMVIGQTDVSQQASALASPLRDFFVVIFFLSVGMLFNPQAIVEHFPLFIAILGIILVIKPLTAFLIAVTLRYPVSTALSLAIALAQIGEFSFILAEEASKYDLFSDEGYDIIVACALISIAINPLLFKLFHVFKPYIGKNEEPPKDENGIPLIPQPLSQKKPIGQTAIVVGFGFIGKEVVQTLEKRGYRTIIIDYNVDKIARLIEEKKEAIYGEASFPNVLENSPFADLMVVTIPDFSASLNIIQYSRALNPNIVVVARSKYYEDQWALHDEGVNLICCEEDEMANAFQRILDKILP